MAPKSATPPTPGDRSRGEPPVKGAPSRPAGPRVAGQ